MEIPQVQFLVVWEVVDMPVHVQRQVRTSWTNLFFLREKWTPALRPLPGSSHLKFGLFLRACIWQSYVSPRAFGRISYFLRESSLGCPRAGSHWKSGHYSYELYGGVYGGQAV